MRGREGRSPRCRDPHAVRRLGWGVPGVGEAGQLRSWATPPSPSPSPQHRGLLVLAALRGRACVF